MTLSTLPPPIESEEIPVRTHAAPTSDRALLLRAIGYCLLGLVTFVIACSLWNLLIMKMHWREATPPVFAVKYDAFATATDAPADTLFLGSSRFYHGIDPTKFDQLNKLAGTPTKSFNLSFNGLNFPETQFLFEQLIADPRTHVKTLVVEPAMRARLSTTLQNSERALALHDLEHSKELADFIIHGNNDTAHKLYWLWFHGGVSATRLSNSGALSSYFVRPHEPGPDVDELLGPDKTGFVGITKKPANWPVVTSSTIAKLVANEEASQKAGTARVLNDYEVGLLNDMEKKANERGMRLVLLMPPTADSDIYGEFCGVARAKAAGKIHPQVLNYCDPATNPDLYTSEGFVDLDHLTPEQAEHLTQRVAADLLAK